MKELKQCPFCGNNKVKKDYIYGTYGRMTMILCDICGVAVSFRQNETESETIESWNRRA